MESQKQRLLELLKYGNAHRTDEIVEKIYGKGMSLSRVGARIWDLKQDGYVFEKGRKDEVNPKLYWYQLKIAETYETNSHTASSEKENTTIEIKEVKISSNTETGQLPMRTLWGDYGTISGSH